ncbi:MAG: exodeoxyribonuclease III [Planctomycetes bacterium]|nr:exodeoxyribonuclease III [Planctomycetota bacterium]
MRIATFNCNSVRSRLQIILDWLDANSPDILALQETKAVDDDFPESEFTDTGWHVVYRGQKSYNGVAVITKEKCTKASFGLQDGLDSDEDSSTRLAHIEYKGIHLINTYVPQGRDLEHEKFKFKLEWFGRLRKYLDKNFKSSAKSKVVWVGDLNVAPTPIDVHDSKKIWPHVCHCQAVIDAFAGVTGFGFIDIFRKHIPEEGKFTFWDYRVRGALERGLGWRIDHILTTPSVAERSTKVEIDFEARKLEKPSDHTFVFADFDL